MQPLPDTRQDKPQELPGYLEYETRTIIRDLVRLHGFEKARELIAQYLIEEANR